jgi:hypothetical protein
MGVVKSCRLILVFKQLLMSPWFTRNYEKSVGRASVPAMAISSRCVKRTLRKNFSEQGLGDQEKISHSVAQASGLWKR